LFCYQPDQKKLRKRRIRIKGSKTYRVLPRHHGGLPPVSGNVKEKIKGLCHAGVKRLTGVYVMNELSSFGSV
jgi:hypothetical protein